MHNYIIASFPVSTASFFSCKRRLETRLECIQTSILGLLYAISYFQQLNLLPLHQALEVEQVPSQVSCG